MTQIIENQTENQAIHTIDGPLTVETTKAVAPGLLRNTIDSRIVKVRPMSTPLDQISRCAAARGAKSMTVEYYSVDTRPVDAKVATTFAGGRGLHKGNGTYSHVIKTDNDLCFDASETLYLPDVELQGKKGIVLYVIGRVDAGIEVVLVTDLRDEEGMPPKLPTLQVGTRIVRMGRAATEMDVMSPQYQALPVKSANNCQIFKMQIEASTMLKIANKEVGWTFSDQEESAVIDMRLGMEKNFLFGVRTSIFDYHKNEMVYFTGGIWNQIDNSHEIDLDNLTEASLIDLSQKVFTGNNGSKRKILLAGSDLLGALTKLPIQKIMMSHETKVKWGVEFREIRSNFGSLYVVHSEIFDQCGRSKDGLIIDPDYLTKYVHIPFNAEKIDLRKSGQRNSDAVVLTEASCLVVRFPNAHCRLIHKQ